MVGGSHYFWLGASADAETGPREPSRNLRCVSALTGVDPARDECPSCGGLNISCPDGCGRDPLTGELNGTRLERDA